jgi:protein TonB
MLTNAAAEAVKQWRYRPTLLNGSPVEAETEVLVNFVGDR